MTGTAPKYPKLGEDKTVKNISRNSDQLDPNRREILIWEAENPRSVINLVSDKVRRHAIELPPELLAMPAEKMKKEHNLTFIDEQLRIAFWDEYFLTSDAGAKSMRMAAVYARVCDKNYFLNFIVENPIRLAYMFHPPEEYMLQMRALLNMGMERFQEFLNLPITKPNGEPNTKLIAELVKIVTIVDNRVKGAVTQHVKIDATQKNLHAHMQVPNPNYEAPKTYAEIQSELRQIENEIKKIRDPNSALDLIQQARDDERPGGEPELIDVTARETT